MIPSFAPPNFLYYLQLENKTKLDNKDFTALRKWLQTSESTCIGCLITCPMTIKPSWSSVKPINLLCFSSGVASRSEKSWNQNKMSGTSSAQKVKTLDLSYSDKDKHYLSYLVSVILCLPLGLYKIVAQWVSGSASKRKPCSQPTYSSDVAVQQMAVGVSWVCIPSSERRLSIMRKFLVGKLQNSHIVAFCYCKKKNEEMKEINVPQ